MVKSSKEKAKRMHEYVLSRFEDSGICIAQQVEPDQYRLERTNVGRVHLFLHTDSDGAEKFGHRIKRLVYDGLNVANVFYNETDSNLSDVFFNYLDEDEAGKKMRTTLKNYTFPQIKAMVKFREKESEVLGLQGVPILTYYRSDNHVHGGRTPEGLVNFEFAHPRKDYSHIEEDRKGRDIIMRDDSTQFVSLGISKNKASLDERLIFVPSRKNSHVFCLGGRADLRGASDQVERYLREEHLRQTGTTAEDWGQQGFDEYLNPE
jgi:hypothetical protein